MVAMNEIMVIQGRQLSSADLGLIRQLMHDNPSWSRTRLSGSLCERWDWRNANGQIKDIACRTLLRKLQQRNLIALPPPLHAGHQRRQIPDLPIAREHIGDPLRSLRPIDLVETHSQPDENRLFTFLLNRYHYLGLRATSVGENIRYLAYDSRRRPLGCLLFGAAAWKIRPRDEFIGWDAATRQCHLALVANNSRLLVLPWVETKHLASHLLALSLRRLNQDWRERYGHPIALVETFVDTSRFRGTCYQAANWIRVGRTAGRTRQDRYSNIHVPNKDVYVFPLFADFRCRLRSSRSS
jgi:hypothetical protein